MALVATSEAEVLSSALRTWRARTPPRPLPTSEGGFSTGYDWRLRQAVDWAAAARADPASLMPGGGRLGGAHLAGAAGGSSASGAAVARTVPTPAERDALLRQLYQALTAFPGGLLSPRVPPPPTHATPSLSVDAATERYQRTPRPFPQVSFPLSPNGLAPALPVPSGPGVPRAAPRTPQTARQPDPQAGGAAERPPGALTPGTFMVRRDRATTGSSADEVARHASAAGVTGGPDAFTDSVYARAVSAAKFVTSAAREEDLRPAPSRSPCPSAPGSCTSPFQTSHSPANVDCGVFVPGVFTPPAFGHGPGCTCAGDGGASSGGGGGSGYGGGGGWSGGGGGGGFGCGGFGFGDGGVAVGSPAARLTALEARRRVRAAQNDTRTRVAMLAAWRKVARR